MRYFFISFILLTSVSANAQIKISAQKNIKFSNYTTFAVQKGQIISLVADRKADENKIFKVLRESIAREMTMRGYVAAEDSVAELIITYVFEEADRSNYQKPGPLGQTPKDDPADINEANRSNISRTLILEIVKNKNSLWTATCPLGASQRDVYGLLDMTTTSAFRKFPKRKNK